MGMSSVLMIGMLSYFLYSILSEHVSTSTREYLSKEAQLAASDIQREFAALKEDLNYYGNRVLEHDGRVDEKRISRLLNKYPVVLDSLFLQMPTQTLLFALDESDSLITLDYGDNRVLRNSSKQLSALSSTGDATLIAKINLLDFFKEVGSPYFESGTKFFYENGKLFELNSKQYEEASIFPQPVLDAVRKDIDEGRLGSYQSPIAARFQGGEEAMQDAVIVQAPFKLAPLPQSFAFLFVEEEKTLLSD